MIWAVIFFILFAGLTIAVKKVDVQPIAAGETLIGLATINNKVYTLTGYNPQWYDLTQMLGLVALGIAGLFALLGLYQLIKRKSLLKVDKKIIALGALYVLTMCFYVLFEKVVINCRPLILPDESGPGMRKVILK